MDYTKDLKLDVNAVNNYLFVQCKQGDALHRKLAITLTADGVDLDLTDAASAMFRCQKPDGHAVIQATTDASNPITKSGNVYTVNLAQQALAVAGLATCDFAVLDSSEKILSSATFILQIIPTPDVGNTLTSTNEFQRLLDAIEDAETFRDILAFRYNSGNLQYTTDGTTWVTLCAGSDLVEPITTAQIDALFLN